MGNVDSASIAVD